VSAAAAARRSRARKAASPKTAINVIVRTAGDDQPIAEASMNANVMPVRNTTANAAPA